MNLKARLLKSFAELNKHQLITIYCYGSKLRTLFRRIQTDSRETLNL